MNKKAVIVTLGYRLDCDEVTRYCQMGQLYDKGLTACFTADEYLVVLSEMPEDTEDYREAVVEPYKGALTSVLDEQGYTVHVAHDEISMEGILSIL